MRLQKVGVQIVTTSLTKTGLDFEHASRAARFGVVEAMGWLLVVGLALFAVGGAALGLWLT